MTTRDLPSASQFIIGPFLIKSETCTLKISRYSCDSLQIWIAWLPGRFNIYLYFSISRIKRNWYHRFEVIFTYFSEACFQKVLIDFHSSHEITPFIYHLLSSALIELNIAPACLSFLLVYSFISSSLSANSNYFPRITSYSILIVYWPIGKMTDERENVYVWHRKGEIFINLSGKASLSC